MPMLKVTHLARNLSDHCPLLVTCYQNNRSPKPLKFMRMRTTHSALIPFIAHQWNIPTTGPPLAVLQTKLKSLKTALKSWNWDGCVWGC